MTNRYSKGQSRYTSSPIELSKRTWKSRKEKEMQVWCLSSMWTTKWELRLQWVTKELFIFMLEFWSLYFIQQTLGKREDEEVKYESVTTTSVSKCVFWWEVNENSVVEGLWHFSLHCFLAFFFSDFSSPVHLFPHFHHAKPRHPFYHCWLMFMSHHS